jgi:heat-inducible transcriptional repressor
MDGQLSPRQHQILISLVREFISTAEPVGSATLTHKYGISASSATIRNDMVRLEEQGYLHQLHTSSGRVPTDKAYRYYVNYLLQRQISIPEDAQEALEEYEQYQDHITNLLSHTGKILADFTHYTSLVLAPRVRRTTFKFLRLTPLDGNRILIILLTNTSALINKVIQLEQSLPEDSLERMTNILNERLTGMLLGDIHLDFLIKLDGSLSLEIIRNISVLTKEVLNDDENRFIYEGTTNLLDLPEFQDLEKLRMIMKLLDEEKMVADILKKTLELEGTRIYIGQEHSLEQVQDCSFITATYRLGQLPLGTIGVMGPKRMPYHKIIPVVNAFAKSFSNKLTKMSNP